MREEKLKLAGECVYCGEEATSVDHLIPQFRNGPDAADNLVPACREYNSSKGSRDAFVWAAGKGFFPVHVTRRYLVLAWRWCERAELLDQGKEVLTAPPTPFGIETQLVAGTPDATDALDRSARGDGPCRAGRSRRPLPAPSSRVSVFRGEREA